MKRYRFQINKVQIYIKFTFSQSAWRKERDYEAPTPILPIKKPGKATRRSNY